MVRSKIRLSNFNNIFLGIFQTVVCGYFERMKIAFVNKIRGNNSFHMRGEQCKHGDMVSKQPDNHPSWLTIS